MPLYKNIILKLLIKNISVSCAESFTGGLLSKIFTDIPGISNIFNMGLITYSNESKNKILNIPKTELKRHGAVSKKIAELMSKKLFKISKSNLCISTTGISGPSGGSKKKPVGLIYIGITFNKKTIVYKKNYIGTRSQKKKKSIAFIFKKINTLV